MKQSSEKTIAIIGGGPAGLMAADMLSHKGFKVTIYDRKPTVGRKFLMAGVGGLNLTHSEDLDQFIDKYREQSIQLKPFINDFTPQDLRDWCTALGQDTFIGSSGRVFPESFKASPLLRAWIERLKAQNVTFMVNHDWQGWAEDGRLSFTAQGTSVCVLADATLLALGGASWPRLGADGSWVDILKAEGVDIAPLRPANCGFCVEWSPIFKERFAGKPLKSIALRFGGESMRGEVMMAANGIEGGGVYALSAPLREEILQKGTATLCLDLKPDFTVEEIVEKLSKPRSRLSLSNFLRKNLNLSDVAMGLLMERSDRKELGGYAAADLAQIIKSYPLVLGAPFGLDRAISTAGGVRFSAMDEALMLNAKQGVFVAGEMLDWEAPTGGYLLQACMSTGNHVAKGMMAWLNDHH